jgi:hypothetical protein
MGNIAQILGSDSCYFCLIFLLTKVPGKEYNETPASARAGRPGIKKGRLTRRPLLH